MPSFVWKHFTKLDHNIAYCNEKGCDKNFKWSKGVSALIRHLRCNHNIIDPKSVEGTVVPNQLKRPRSSDTDSDEEDDEQGTSEEMIDRHVQNKSIKLEICQPTKSEDNLEFIGISGQPLEQNQRLRTNGHSTSTPVEDEKFIKTVYPEFKGKSKLELIDEIRLLRDKVQLYKGTIDRLLKK